MEDYPEELRTPPVALLALVGCPELHSSITSHLHSSQPPINALALPDFSKISVIAKAPKEKPSDPSQPRGILRRDWLAKHRTRVPSVVAALFSSDHVSGDPAQWLQVCTDLENLKAVISGRNIKLVLVLVVNSTSKDDISEDRMIALRKRAEVDSKYIITLIPNDASELQQSLSRLGSTFAELANTYYRDEGRRIRTRIEKKSVSSIELNIRYCFKVAVYAEFRRDWGEALRLYEDAYTVLQTMVKTSTKLPSIQHLVEIKTVAEQLNFKISTLLLHGGRIMEAIMWFRRHVASYRKLIGAPEVNFVHWEWLSRQFLVFAELLDTSAATIQAIVSPGLDVDRPTEWEFSSAYYYQLAASYLKEKQSCLELALSMSESDPEIDRSVESVITSDYVGQFARLIEHGELFEMELLEDEDYVYYALAEGKRFLDSFEIIALLKKSFETFSNVNARRMASYCEFQIAREYFSVSDFNNAKQMFDSIVVLYRREGWVTLLWDVLGYLRECSRRLGSVKDFIEYSLEMAGLPVSSLVTGMQSFKKCGPAGPACLSQREVIHKEVFGLVRGESAVASSDSNCLNISGDHPLFLEVDLVSPLRIVLLASVAFHEQIVKPGIPTLITLSLLSQLPHTFEIDQLEIQFNQADCNFIIVNGQRPQLAAISHVPPGRRVETAPDLALVTNKWLRLRFDINSEQSGKLECIYVLARIGPNFTICCRAESPASMDDLPLWKFEDRVETFPTKDPGLAFSGQKATQVEEPDPQVDLKIGSFGPALVGERFVVPVTVASKGHSIYSGELKINLVDVRGGGLLSPREVQSFSEDNLHVQLLGISGLDCSDESRNGSDSIQKIQQSFGLVSVPFLNGNGLWSCKLEIRWHRPKPIMLYVSLGYSPHSNEPAAQRGQVHKSLQIEGITAVVVGHQYMLPFRREPLLLSKVKPVPDSNNISSLPLKKTSILIVRAKNCSEIPLQLLSLSVEEEEDVGSSCIVQQKGEDFDEPESLVAGEEFKKVFTVTPGENLSKLNMGTVCVRWSRDSRPWEQTGGSTEGSEVWTKHKLSDVSVELPPLVVTLVCPPHAILGNPFTYSIRIHNQTQLLQEVKFSVADSQSFVLSGSHSDTIFVLPKSEHSLDYMLVPLASGTLLLPRVTITSTRYSATFQPSVDASTVFVFPSDPQFMMIREGETIKESSAAQS